MIDVLVFFMFILFFISILEFIFKAYFNFNEGLEMSGLNCNKCGNVVYIMGKCPYCGSASLNYSDEFDINVNDIKAQKEEIKKNTTSDSKNIVK